MGTLGVMAKIPGATRAVYVTLAAVVLAGLVLPSLVVAPVSDLDVARNPAAGPAAAGSPAPDSPASMPASDAIDLDGYVAARPAAPSAQSTPSVPTVSAPGGATPVRMTPNHPSCGAGLTLVELEGGGAPASCVHDVMDPVPTRPANRGAVRMQPICHGNGVNGPRIQFIYVYAEGEPNRAAEYIPHMLNSWIPAMEGAFRSTSLEQGREIGMRVYMPNCQIEIGVVQMNADDATPDNPGAMRSRIEAAIRAAGFTEMNRKYHAWFDGANLGACGVAPALLSPGAGDNATPANVNNLGSTPIVNAWPQVAVTFKLPFPLPPGSSNPAPACWDRGGMGALTETHELLHLLGSVSYSAPNSNGLGHCRDEVDIMCYSEGGVLTVERCAIEVEALDCGSDDYFNARPQLGSYLSLNWNTANSKFLGIAVEDNVPAEIPSP